MLLRIVLRALLAALAVLMLSTSIYARAMTELEKAKTSSYIIETSEAGKPQTLFIEFEHQAILDRYKAKYLTLAPTSNYDTSEDIGREYDAIRAELFPDGRLGDMYIAEEYSNSQPAYGYRTSPIAAVNVPNIQSLEQLLAHPKITRIYRNQFFFKTFGGAGIY